MKREKIERLEFKQMGFFYNSKEKVFENVNFHFQADEVLYLQGPRGSGKNTLIKILLGLNSPTEGEFLINGVKVNDFSFQEFDQFRLNIGHSYDVGGLINNLSLYENFRLVLDYHDFLMPEERDDYIKNLMMRFHLDEQKDLRPALISSSARKAASVLRAFLLRPEIVILNDPSQGMSMEHVTPLVELIKEHQEKHSLKYVIISSDDTGLIGQLAGRVVMVNSQGLFDSQQLRRAS